MEETIGYEALFSPEEWAAIDFGDWDRGPDGPSFSSSDLDSSSGAAAAGPGSAAQEGAAAPEGSPSRHTVTVSVVDDGYELSCDACDLWDHLSDVCDADNLKRLHEQFVATLVSRYEVK